MFPELRMWLELSLEKKSIEPFFEKNNIKTIAIYGCAYLGERFFSEIQKYGVEVKYCIDREVTEFHGFSVLKPSQINFINEIDIVVICIGCLPNNMPDVYNAINGKVPAISLREILQICFYKEITIPYCEGIGVVPYIFSWPTHDQLQNLSAFEKAIKSILRGPDYYATNPAYFEDIYNSIPEYGNEYIRHVFMQSPVIKKGNTKIHSDINSKYVNIIQGIRFTHGVPESFSKTIHILGGCVALGFGVDDSRTISSYLQKALNALPDDGCNRFRVLNHGVWGVPSFANESITKLRSIHCDKGDIIIFFFDHFLKYQTISFLANVLNEHRNVFFSVFEEFCKPRDGKPLYFDWVHLSHCGMERTAQYMFSILKNEKILLENADADVKTVKVLNPENAVLQKKPETLEDYVSFLKLHKRDDGISGAIVMNCNPFTNGHRYLIETAASNVDFLYIFVVEENKSDFAFEDRINLVKLGTADLKNVAVLPSGKFIISSITFPEYFVKDALKDVIINPSKDVAIFAEHIAPALNISKRFVGQEPLDPITAQYNRTMKDILPKYNIDVVIIDRLNIDNEPVSASKVRKLLKDRKMEDLKKYVPETTLTYLTQINHRN